MNIELHPKYGVNATILQYVCPILNKVWESGELAFLGYNKNQEAKMHTMAGYQICPEAQEHINNGYKALVVVDDAKTKNVKNPHRTGEILWIKSEAANAFFPDLTGSIAYMSDVLAKKIKERVKEDTGEDIKHLTKTEEEDEKSSSTD